MKYTRKINKHYEYLSQEGYLDGINNPFELLKSATALLEGGSCHYFASSKLTHGLSNSLNSINRLAFSDKIYGDSDELVNIYILAF